jgi:uncharacterized tellurite resistance protein B-like protein
MTNVLNIFQAERESTAEAPPSIFDLDKLTQQFKSQRATDWSAAEIFLCLLLAAAGADGNVCREEHAEIQALAMRLRTLKSLTAAQLAAVNATVTERMRTRRDGLREACESLPQDMRLPIFAHCVDIVLADGALLPVEADFLNRVASHMGIDSNDGKRVLEVMLLKNQF